MALKDLIANENTPIAEISAFLDGLAHEARLAEVNSLGKRAQAALFQRAADSSPIALAHFVPPVLPSLREVIHYGKNTLPLFTRFQKRFCRPVDTATRLYGYNEGATRGLIGPGYFVAYETRDNPAWFKLGPVVIDYFQVPDGEVADGWPRVVPNSHGLQMFVYNKTRDFMRSVSSHVSIGAAYRGEKAMGAYFVLCRESLPEVAVG